MTAPKTGFPDSASRGDTETSAAWSVVGSVGLALFVVGVVDVLLAWIPLHVGSPEWEFGTISATLNNMPVPAMGFALVLAGAAARDRRAQLLGAAVWSIAVTLFLAGCAVFYVLDVPLALRSVQEPVARSGLQAGIIKAAAALVAYGLFHIWSAVFAIRRLRGP